MNDAAFRPRLVVHALVLTLIGIGILLVCGAMHGRHFAEKIVTQLALPCGLIWLALLWLTYVAFWRDRWRLGLPLLFVFLFYWAAGSWYTGDAIAELIERPYPHVEIDKIEPFDYLIVLGGGVRINDQGDIWLNCGGDRVVMAARLYHQGKVRHLIASGEGFEWSPGGDVSRKRIWRDLGIPEEAIIEIGGRNTSEEMEHVSRLVQQLRNGSRVGLLTSAYHLPRALRLAKTNGIVAEPVPADFLSGPLDPTPLSLIPSRRGFHRTELCLKEWLAAIVGR